MGLRAIKRILAILAGYLCSLVVAVFGIGLVFAALAAISPEPGSWAFIGVSPVLMLASPVVAGTLVLFAGVVTAVPALVFVVPCEIFGLRTARAYLAFGAITAGVAYYAFSFRVIAGFGATAAVEMAAFAVAGALGGLAYWAISGRRAGAWSVDR